MDIAKIKANTRHFPSIMASLYQNIIRPLLFLQSPENAHNFSLSGLKWAERLGLPLVCLRSQCSSPAGKEVKLWDLEFPNPVGLAAGMDKDAEVIRPMLGMGFGFVEVGTVTPVAQPGNPKPRLFRYPQHHAVVNRMGFNNDGLDSLVSNVSRFKSGRPCKGVIGINIGKQKDTPNEEAHLDYLKGFEATADLADYVAVNISSPNTPNLRELQDDKPLQELLKTLKEANTSRTAEGKRHVPTLLKIAPDLEDAHLEQIVSNVVDHQWDGIIATNTTIDRSGDYADFETPGGLSGRPVKKKSTAVIQKISKLTGGKLPIIGVGGIETAADAQEKLDAGASLVQVYSGFIYQGPKMARRIVQGIKKPA